MQIKIAKIVFFTREEGGKEEGEDGGGVQKDFGRDREVSFWDSQYCTWMKKRQGNSNDVDEI
jgi:hypothetical protein